MATATVKAWIERVGSHYRVVMQLDYPRSTGPDHKPRETIRSELLSRAAARVRLEEAYALLKERLAAAKLKITKDSSRGMAG
jgi:hypothetical protein